MHRKLIEIKHQNRWADCVLNSKGDILFEVDNFSEEFIEEILETNEQEVTNAYERGMKEGVKIAEEVYKK